MSCQKGTKSSRIYAEMATTRVAMNFLSPDLVLRDVALAEVPGLDLLQSVRGLFDCGRLPVIPWSSTDHAEDVDRAYELGANSFVVKPVDFGGLQNILGRLLSFWGGRVQVPGCSRAPRSIAETC